ncbi:hypothetical protein GCM10010404_89420 [Nonomuraea africana]|uniref:Outer membrane murein-binding lipoprotein Lpp n=1 Tax=Nonomuraea africana TaxID=46171 RepID=A0ABR9KAN2_9ACTN|nr:DUF4352 domain-containing protein [Nonomuraea africana]MBE1559071.1 outer membrane murein-binding lipoprotein Lpp [Nonomuraea africana]
MSYPQDPYGQQPPHGQQRYGYGPPQRPPGYGYQPPTQPPPPQRNIGVIVLLAVGLPLLLLAGCAAVVITIGGNVDQVVTTADEPNARVNLNTPSQPPTVATQAAPETGATDPAGAPSSSAQSRAAAARVGEAITLAGNDPGLQVAVTVNQVFAAATSANAYMKPKTGYRYVGVQVTLNSTGQAVYSDAPSNGAVLIDSEGQQYRSTIGQISEGQSFEGSVSMNPGDSRKGVIVFEVPEKAVLTRFQFGLNSGFATEKGEWLLN